LPHKLLGAIDSIPQSSKRWDLQGFFLEENETSTETSSACASSMGFLGLSWPYGKYR
jgi:hypothetical protein